MINQLISMAAWKGMSDKRFPLWTLINAYNQQPERFAEMQRSGFFPTEQGPMPLGQPQAAQQALPVQVESSVETHITSLANEVKALKDEIFTLVSHSKRQHARVTKLEEAVIGSQQSRPPVPS